MGYWGLPGAMTLISGSEGYNRLLGLQGVTGGYKRLQGVTRG